MKGGFNEFEPEFLSSAVILLKSVESDGNPMLREIMYHHTALKKKCKIAINRLQSSLFVFVAWSAFIVFPPIIVIQMADKSILSQICVIVIGEASF